MNYYYYYYYRVFYSSGQRRELVGLIDIPHVEREREREREGALSIELNKKRGKEGRTRKKLGTWLEFSSIIKNR